MRCVNENFLELQDSYLFSTVAKKVNRSRLIFFIFLHGNIKKIYT